MGVAGVVAPALSGHMVSAGRCLSWKAVDGGSFDDFCEMAWVCAGVGGNSIPSLVHFSFAGCVASICITELTLCSCSVGGLKLICCSTTVELESDFPPARSSLKSRRNNATESH